MQSDAMTSGRSKANWDFDKLLQLGVRPDFVSLLNPDQARDVVKGLLYLAERSLSERA